MVSIAVCDDEIMECCHMAGKIKSVMDGMKEPYILRQFQSGKELLGAAQKFDIVFLDIMMKGLNGMKTAELLREKTPESLLVFITSTRKYVFEAYDVEAFHYLVKPVDDTKLENVLQRAVRKKGSGESVSQGYIVISRDRQKEKLFLDDIYYFEIMGRLIYTHGKTETSVFYERIGVLEKSLQGKGFFRCHKSFLINLKYVNVYNRQEAILDNGEKIVIAKRRYEDFCKEILNYMRKNGGMA